MQRTIEFRASAAGSSADGHLPRGQCLSVHDFEKSYRIGAGTYGTVYRAVEKASREVVALKKVILHNEKQVGFPVTSLREVRLLKRLEHPNCVSLRDVAVGKGRDHVFLVFEYCEHDMASLIENMGKRFSECEVKCLMVQLLQAVEYVPSKTPTVPSPLFFVRASSGAATAHKQHCCNLLSYRYLHDHWIIHRDLKMSNLLYNSKGQLKLADFGLARLYGSPAKPLTPKVVTLWYRAPELLLGADIYGPEVDLWAAGCILGELVVHAPLMPGKDEVDQINRIFQLLGTPDEHIWPGVERMPLVEKGAISLRRNWQGGDLSMRFKAWGDTGVQFLADFLTYNPSARLTARQALAHSYFKTRPAPQKPEFMPIFPTKHAAPNDQQSSDVRDTAPGEQPNEPAKRRRQK
jgi:serine/threonine protein kinase